MEANTNIHLCHCPLTCLSVPTLPMTGSSEDEHQEVLSAHQYHSSQWAYKTSVDRDLLGLSFSSSHSELVRLVVWLSSPSIISGRYSHHLASSGSRLSEQVISRQPGLSGHGSTTHASSSTKSNLASSMLLSQLHIIEFNALKELSYTNKFNNTFLL